MTWVVDSSVAIAWCFEDETTVRTEALLDRLESDVVIVPQHWGLEVTNVLRSTVRRGRLTEDEAALKCAVLMSLPLRQDSLTSQLAFTTIYQLARTHGLTTYDAAYLELAARLGLPLATDDKQLRLAAEQAGVVVL